MKMPRILLSALLLALAITGWAGAAERRHGCDTNPAATAAPAPDCHGSVPRLLNWSEAYEKEQRAAQHADTPPPEIQQDAGQRMAGTILLPLRMTADHALSLLDFLVRLCVQSILGP